jgi:hypothetical protein
MKRGLLVAALVLVPFAVLVALGFYFSEGAETPLTRPDEQRLLLVPTVIPHPVAEDAGVIVGDAAPIPALVAPLEPQVRRCFSDAHVRGRIHVRFTPQRDGGFEGITVDQNSTQNPYLAACVEDVLQGAAFQPSPGPDYERVDFTFSF